MKKLSQKTMAIILALFMVFGAAPFIGFVDFSASAVSESDLTFTLINEDTEYEITACSATALGDLTIPSTYNSLPVTSIGNSAFANNNNITSVIIPGSVTSIGVSAFSGCYGISSVSLAEGLTTIGRGAFVGCKIENITLPESLTDIGQAAFYETRIKSITVPAGVTSIGTRAFSVYYCEEIIVDSENESYSSLDGVLFNKDKTQIIQYPRKKYGTSYEIPNTVTNIDQNCFLQSNYLCTVIIPNSVTTIGHDAFAYISTLESIEIPDSVVSLGGNNFIYDTSLKNVTIGKGLNTLGGIMFRDCQELESLTISPENTSFIVDDGVVFNSDKTKLIYYPAGKSSLNYIVPDGVTTIGLSAFAYSKKLKGISFPESLATIESGAFYESGIETAYVPANITEIKGNLFSSCSSLLSIEVNPENPSYSSADGIMYNKDKSKLIAYPIGRSDTSYEIAPGIITIGQSAIKSNGKLKSIMIPYGATRIEEDAFWDCKSLESVYIPSTVNNIDSGAFKCNSLTDVYYSGTQEEWESISIHSYANQYLTGANIHYNFKFDVTWNLGDDVVEESYEYGEPIVIPEEAEKTGYTTIWDAEIPATMLPENLGFTASWTVNTYTVTWDVDGTETTVEYEYGEAIEKLADPEKEGYTFTGWGADVPDTMPAENLKFTDNWEANTYEVKWIVKDEITTVEYAYGAPIVIPENPTVAGYKFTGWSEAIPATMPARDITFYAEFDCITTLKSKNNPGSRTINYGDGVKLTVEATNLPEYGEIRWYIDGYVMGTGETFTLEDARADTKIYVKVADKMGSGTPLRSADGEEISDSETITVKAGFFQKLISFFKNLFKANRIIAQAFVSDK